MTTSTTPTPVGRATARKRDLALVGPTDEAEAAQETPRIHYRGAQEGTATRFAKTSNGSVVVTPTCHAAWERYCKEVRHSTGEAYEIEVRAFVYAFDARGDLASRAVQDAALIKQFQAGKVEGYETAREVVRNRVVAPLGLTIASGRRGDLAAYCDTLAEALRVEREVGGQVQQVLATAVEASVEPDPLRGLPATIRGAIETLILELGIVVEERDATAKDAARYHQFRAMLRED